MSLNEWTPATAAELARMVADNFIQARTPLAPVGGRTALHFGGVPAAEARLVVLSELNAVVDYPARDMTITVGAGMRIEDLRERLAAERQCLPVDIPQAHRATIGGAIATNTSGPSRYGHGTLRDYVIGISGVDGQGRLFSAGGRVVKNVAGYDLCKLLIGSLGTLAIITQVTLKLRPLPATRSFLWLTFDDPAALEPALTVLNLSETRPVILDVLNPKAVSQIQGEARQELPADGWGLCLGFEGSLREIEWQLDTAAQELRTVHGGEASIISGNDAEQLHSSLVEYQAASDDPVTLLATLSPSRTMELCRQADARGLAVQAHAGNGIMIGHLPDRCTDAAAAGELISPLRTFAGDHGGALTILNCDEEWRTELDVFGPETSSWTIMRGLKQSLDPAGVLNPGRLL